MVGMLCACSPHPIATLGAKRLLAEFSCAVDRCTCKPSKDIMKSEGGQSGVREGKHYVGWSAPSALEATGGQTVWHPSAPLSLLAHASPTHSLGGDNDDAYCDSTHSGTTTTMTKNLRRGVLVKIFYGYQP